MHGRFCVYDCHSYGGSVKHEEEQLSCTCGDIGVVVTGIRNGRVHYRGVSELETSGR